jgi:hypothetical protein
MIFHPLKKILKCLGGLLVVALLWSFAHEATAQPTKTASPNASKKATATSEGNVEKKLRAKLHQQFGQDTVIGAITKTPYGNAAVHGGLYEVFMNGRVHYTDAQLTFFIAGC